MNDVAHEPQPEDERERLSRECREMYDDLAARGAITGTYAEWLKAAAEEAAKKMERPQEQPLVQVVRSTFKQ